MERRKFINATIAAIGCATCNAALPDISSLLPAVVAALPIPVEAPRRIFVYVENTWKEILFDDLRKGDFFIIDDGLPGDHDHIVRASSDPYEMDYHDREGKAIRTLGIESDLEYEYKDAIHLKHNPLLYDAEGTTKS